MFVLILFLIISTNPVQSQRTISEIEEYIFSSIFNSDVDNKIFQLIEENEKSEVTRKWEFNERGYLSKEYDWRESGFTFRMGGQISSSSTTNYKEILYDYLPNNKIDKLIEMTITTGDTLKIIHQFDYSMESEIKESFRIKKDEFIDLEFIIRTKSSNGLIDTILNNCISHIGEGYVESKIKDVITYDKGNRIKNKVSYFSINSYPVDEHNKLESEQLGLKSTYSYDDFGKILEILEYEFDENGDSKLNRKINFEYNKISSKIIKINLILGESYKPRELKYEIKYEGGIVKSVEVNDKKYFYQIKGK